LEDTSSIYEWLLLDTNIVTAHLRKRSGVRERMCTAELTGHPVRLNAVSYYETNQREQARAELSAAIALYRAMDLTFWLPQAKTALAQAEGRS
jgi:hypothetical protein